ncbi:helix-hairpin-helix domain-containing protein [Nocardioides baekrokdamisoli]|nr:helix-hairpin-helix domain-containing protein [Nocardioides baekrokdamisoli]
MPGNQLRLVDPLSSAPPWEEYDDPPVIPMPGRHVDARPSAFAEALVPQRWRGRFELGPWHVVAVVVAACVALAAATWLTLRHQPHVVTGHGSSSATGAVPVAAPVTSVTVDVEGTVRKPGIVVLRAGARVVDAVKGAGGSFHRDQLSGLNLATVLTDGQQVVVGAAVATGPGGAGASDGLVNLNTASADDLDAIPGVGPVTAEAIVSWRQRNGSFHTVDELLEVDGIGPGKFAKIKPHVSV